MSWTLQEMRYANINYSNKCVNSNKDAISREMEFYETESLENSLENSSGIAEAFKTLINLDTDLYNRILQYEPIDIEQLRSTLKTHGFKCKLSNLMSYLDGQVRPLLRENLDKRITS